MNEHLLQWLQSLDLVTTARDVIDFVALIDPFLIAGVLGVFVLLGSRMASSFPGLRSWGLRAAAAMFLGYLGYFHFGQGGINGENYPTVLARAVIAAEMLLIPIWTVLPVLLFILTRIRLVIAAFVIYVTYSVFQSGSFDMNRIQEHALGGAIAAAVVLLVAWILQPFTDFIADQFRKSTQPRTKVDGDDVGQPTGRTIKSR